MPSINLDTAEARLISIYRAIREFDKEFLIGPSDVGDAAFALEAVVDLAELEANKSADEVKSFVAGFVAGLGASRLGNIIDDHPTAYESLEDETQFTGGPTGGVAEGQGTDPRYVTQTGVREDN